MSADAIREFVAEHIILPARKLGETYVLLKTGEISKRMGLDNRMPAVCSALEAKKFQFKYGVKLVDRDGPAQGSAVFYLFEI